MGRRRSPRTRGREAVVGTMTRGVVLVALVLALWGCNAAPHNTRPHHEHPLKAMDKPETDLAQVETGAGVGRGVMNSRALVGALLGFPLGYVGGTTTLQLSGAEADQANDDIIHGIAGSTAGFMVADEGGAKKDEAIGTGSMAGLLAGAIGHTMNGLSAGGEAPPAPDANAAPKGPSATSQKVPVLHTIFAGGVAGMGVSALDNFVNKLANVGGGGGAAVGAP